MVDSKNRSRKRTIDEMTKNESQNFDNIYEAQQAEMERGQEEFPGKFTFGEFT